MPNFEAKANHKASGATTTSGNTTSDATGMGRNLAVLLDVTAASGTTPSLDVKVQWSHNGSVWFDADGNTDTFTQITAAKQVCKVVDVKAPLYRLNYTIGGTTPSFTWAAHTYVN